MKLVVPVAFVIALVTSGVALADDNCRSSMADWQSREAAMAHVQRLGINADRLKIDDGCYEIRGRDADGNTVELKLEPGNLAVVNLEVEFRSGADPSRYLAGALGSAANPTANPTGTPGRAPQASGN